MAQGDAQIGFTVVNLVFNLPIALVTFYRKIFIELR